ncbi:MAG: NADH-quinone oxidoreductase subunit H [Holosporaceae bacterium]|nr:MAG: NADH-quinone oxidoreductase subunit H [Holosporaceae bacterium]
MALVDILVYLVFYSSALLIGSAFMFHVNGFLRLVFSGGFSWKSLSLNKISLPFYEVLNLFSWSPIPKETLSVHIFTILPFLYFFLLVLSSLFLPWGAALFVSSEEGIFWFVLLVAFIHLLTLMMSWVAQTVDSMWGLPYLFIAFCSACFVLFMVVLPVSLWVGSMNLERVVAEQASLWFVAPLFPVFLLYLIFVIIFCHQSPFGIMNISGKMPLYHCAEYVGGMGSFLILTEYLMFILMCGFGVTLFWGGALPLKASLGWPPMAWFLMKLGVFMMLVTWISSSMPNMRRDQALKFLIKGIFPFSCATFIVYVFLKTILF